MGLFLCSVESQRSTNMQLHIRGSSNYVLEFSGAESLAELKAKVAECEGTEDVLLYVAGKPVDYEMAVSSIGECHVDVTVPLMGGKVRGQTPKVEAQEKKKKRTGRAKRRIQYNRRFVNVVQTFGRRRGPNANS